MIGRVTFQVATTLAPVAAVLEIQLQNHEFDVWALGSAAVAAVMVALLHVGRAASDPPMVVLPKPPP